MVQVSQTNNPNVSPVRTNEIDIVTDDNMLNACNEAGSGNNEAFCENTAYDIIDSITQDNFVASSSGVGAGFVESNTVNALQGFDLINTCDESGDGVSIPICTNTAENFIGPVDQSNDITGTTPNTIHSNNFEVSQFKLQQMIAMNQAMVLELMMHRAVVNSNNAIESLGQENDATGADNAAQTNDFSAPARDLVNDCNESGDGTNDVSCDLDIAENFVSPLGQSNFIGSSGANISQNNEIDGDDAWFPGYKPIHSSR